MGERTRGREGCLPLPTPPAGGGRNEEAAAREDRRAWAAASQREALTQEALLIHDDGVILRCLSQTEEFAPGWTDRQTQDVVLVPY